MRRRSRFAILVLLILAVAAGLTVARIQAGRRFRQALEQAKADMESGLFGRARQTLSRLHGEQPAESEVSFHLGACELARGAPEQALMNWSKIIPTSEWSAIAALPAAQAAISLGRIAAAEQILRAALDRPLPQTPAILHLALILMVQQGRSQDARILIESVWQMIPPTFPGATSSRLVMLRDHVGLDLEPFPLESNSRMLEQGRSPATAEDQRALALARAHLATMAGDFDRADAELNQALKRWPDDQQMWKAKLDWAIAAGDRDAAAQALTVLERGQAGSIRDHRAHAWLARQHDQAAKETEALEQVLREQPGDLAAISRLAERKFEAGDLAGASELRRRKADINLARDRYHRLYKEDRFCRPLAELEQLATKLGRTFEAVGFGELLAAHSTSETGACRLARGSANQGRLAPALQSREPLVSSPSSTAGSDRVVSAKSGTSSPSQERILTPRPRARADHGPFPRFEDRARAAGLALFMEDNGQSPIHQLPEMACGGVGLLDYDGDGRLDIYCVQGGAFPPSAATSGSLDRLFRNRGDGTFEDVSVKSGIAGMPGGYGHGVAVGDYDHDGHPDLFVTRWRSYALYRNRGNGTFEDRSATSGFGGDRDWPTSAAFADFDNDGDLDLYVCHYAQWDESNPKVCKDPTGTVILSCDPRSIESRPDHLFRNDGGRFIEITEQAGIVDRNGRGFGVVAADFDQDGLVDIFVANDGTANFLFRNLGHLTFEEVGQVAGVAANASGGYQAGMGVACGDVDGNGRLDLAVTNYYAESTSLFLSLGQGFFADRTAPAQLAAATRNRLGFGVAFLDANNDGWLDLLTANGHVSDQRPLYPYAMAPQLLLGSADGTFLDATAHAGPPFEQESVGRGLAVGDLDNDGRLDAVLVAQNEPLIHLSNQPGAAISHFVTFQLEGTRSNRDGVGAIVKVTAGGRVRMGARFGGGSYQSSSDPRLHFGLGSAATVDAVEVDWPSGRVDRHRQLLVDRIYRLREGAAAMVVEPGTAR